jgi:hypothetical protein
MKNTLKSLILSGLLLFGATACMDDLNVQSIDPNQQSEIDLDAVFVKIYSTLALTGQKGPDGKGDIAGIDEGTSSFYRMIFSLNEYSADQIFWIWPDVGVDDIRNAAWTSSNALVKGLYSRLYFDIALCNLYLEQTENAGSDAVAQKRAEVRFIRALNYYYLLDMFSGVPFVTKMEKENPQPISRPALYEWLTGELNDLEPALAEAGHRTAYYRVDKAAAWLLLSRIYLNAEVYRGTADYNNAALYAKKVIDSPYGLASKYAYLFMGDNDNLSAVNDAFREIILPIGQDGIQARSWGGSMFLIAATHTSGMEAWGSTESWKCIRSRTELVHLFFPLGAKYDNINNAFVKGNETVIKAAAADERAMFCNYMVYQDTLEYICLLGRQNKADDFFSGWSITKHTNLFADSNRKASDTQHPDTDIPFMRKAEAYLNYAEAVLRGAAPVDGLTPDVAVNALRTRANAQLLTGVTLEQILDERGREFYCEGYRRSDLVRFDKFGGNTGYLWEWKGGAILGKNFDTFRNIYPIPQSDLVENDNLKPTEGYN